jgi:hypothetical protein
MKSMRTKGIILSAVGSILWGSSGIAGQYLLSDAALNAEWLALFRLFTAGFILLLWHAITGGALFALWKNKKDAMSIFWFGAVGMVMTQYMYFVTIKHSNAATATVIQYLMPIFIIGWICFIQKRLPKKKEIFCALCAVLGTTFIATHGHFDSLAISKNALIFGLLSAVGAAFYTLQPQRIIKKYPSPLVVGWGMMIGGCTMIPLVCTTPFTGTIDLYTLMAFLYVVIFGTVLSFVLYLASIRYIEPGETGIIASLEPLSTILFSFLILGMTFGTFELMGMVLIIAAVIAVTR